MKAAINTRYGPPEMVTIREVDKPVPAVNEILIKIHASTVNRTDYGFRSTNYFISRFWSGLFKPRFHILGCEFAGHVEAVGSEVTSFQPGERVFGYDDRRCGGKKVLFPIPAIHKNDVLFLRQLAQDRKFMPVIDSSYALEQIVDAYRYVETGQKTGNVVLLMEEKVNK